MKRSLLASAVAALLAAPALAAPSAIRLTFQKTVLPNGLTVIVHEDHAVPVVAVNIWYKVGSNDEKAGKTGFAHLFEHYMFMGSEHSPYGQFDQQVGGCGGMNNATTNKNRTDYFEIVPSECLEEMLRLESDRMGFLANSINQDSLDKQRAVVKNEKRLGDNKPYGALWETVHDTVWPDGHPNKHDTIGSMADLDAASVADVREFHATYYVPNNAILVLSGDVDAKDAVAKVEKWFGSIPAGATPTAAKAPMLPAPAGRKSRTVTDDKASVPMVVIAYPIPGQGQPGYLELSAVASVLSDGRSSRLTQSLQYEKRLAVEAWANMDDLHDASILVVGGIPAPGVSVETLTAALEAEVAAIARDGIKSRELTRVKAGLRTAHLDALQEAEGVAEAMAENQKIYGDPSAMDRTLDQLQKMRAKDAQSAAARYLTPDNASIVVISPKTGGRP